MAANSLIPCILVTIFCFSCFGEDIEEKCAWNLKGCYCTDTYIDCQGAEFTEISEIYPYITAQTYRIHITGGRIRSIPNNVFTRNELTGPLNEVVYLNLSGNYIETVGKMSFQQLPNLNILDLSDNDISINLCDQQNDLSVSLGPLTKIEELYLRHVFSRDVTAGCDPGNVFSQTEMSELVKLDLSSNHFDLIGPNMERFLCKRYSIRSLNLSKNNFDRLPVSQCMTNLVELDLANNQISVLTADEIDILESLVNLKALQLGGNPFTCDCYLEATFNWINATQVPLDFANIVCGGQTDNIDVLGKSFKDLKYSDICGAPEIIVCYGPGGRKIYLSQTTFIVGISAGLVLLISIVTVVIVLCRRRRRRLRLQIPGNSEVSKTPAYRRIV